MKGTIVRIVVVGSPQEWPGGQPSSPNFRLAKKMLKRAVDHHDWPSTRVLFAITPGGFIQARMPDYDGCRGWASRPDDFRSLIPTAEGAVWEVIDEDIRAKLAKRARFLTVGIDLVPPGRSKTASGSDTWAELVGVVDLDEGVVVRWTGKSYPQCGQEERTLVQEPCLESHLLSVAGERVLVLGCHDLNVFNRRARANAKSRRQRRWQDMDGLARHFKPTMVLHHPHQTDASTWRLGWSGLRCYLKFGGPYASGIAYFPKVPDLWKARCPLENVLRETRCGDVIDIRVNGHWSGDWEQY